MVKNVVAVSVLSVLLCPAAHAIDFELFKFADFGIRGTDNFQQLDETEELVASVKPSVLLEFTGNRFEGDATFEVEFYRFNEQDFGLIDPRLELNSTGSIIQNVVFFDARLNVGKVLPEEDIFDIFEDADTLTRIRINPFISRKFGRSTDFFLGYGFQSLSDGDNTSQQDTFEFTLAKDPRFGGFIWGVGGQYQADDSGGVKFENSSVFASAGYTIGQPYYFEVRAGQEINDFEESLNIDDDNTLLAASLTWTPSERTTLNVGYSERSFGSGPTLSLDHTVRNSLFTANYNRSISTSEVTLGALTSFNDGQTTDFVPVGNDGLFDVNGVSVNLAPFIEDRFQLGYKLAGRRSDLIIDAVYTQREQLSGSDDDIEELLGRIAFDRLLSPLTTFRIQYDLLIDDETGDREVENQLGFRFIYNFDRKERESILTRDADN